MRPSNPGAPYRDALMQLADYGIDLETLDTSGTLVRRHHREDRHGTKNAWYVARELVTTSGRVLIVGSYGWWKEGTTHALRHDGRGLSIDEQREVEAQRRALERQAQAARDQVAAAAAVRGKRIWAKLPLEGPSKYLERKQVCAAGIRFARGSVVVPVRTGPTDDDLVGLQWIDPDGAKRFLTGTVKRGAWCLLTDPPEPGAVLLLGEGYATVASAHMATQWAAACAFDAGNLLQVAHALATLYPLAKLVLLADDDHATPGNPGVTRATEAAKAVGGILSVPRFASADPDRGTDFNDLHVAEGLQVVRGQIVGAVEAAELVARAAPRTSVPPAPAPDLAPGEGGSPPSGPPPGGSADPPKGSSEWSDRLMRTDKGGIRATAFNIRLILENEPRWSGVIAWDDFAQRIVARKDPPIAHASRGEWSDAHDTELRHWLAGTWHFEPKKTDIADAVLGVALANKFHPVREYLDRLVWDEQPRLDSWLQTYVGAGDTRGDMALSDAYRAAVDRYLSLVGPWWMIQSVARVRRPGCKADNVLIFEGEQGILKSTVLKMLYSAAWFSDTRIDIGSKDAMLSMQGVWCIELAELDALNKADMRTAKAYFSSAEDRFRLPYGHRLGRFPRQSVMAGTTNQREYLQDMTGNRRYWPVACGEIDLQGIEADRDQLWAEAQTRFDRGERWWEETPEEKTLIGEQQGERVAGDVWETRIQEFLSNRLRACPPDRRLTLFVSMDSIMEQALGMAAKDMKRPEQTRVGIILQALGWAGTRPWVAGERVRGYRPGYRVLDAQASNPTATIGGDDDLPPF